MNPAMSSALVRNVCRRTTSRQRQPPASRTAPTFANACLVWAMTSSPARPSRSVPTCPATTRSSPAAASMPCEYIPRGFPNSRGVTTLGMAVSSGEPDVLEVQGLAVDAARRRRDPAGELSGLGDGAHQALDPGLGLRGRQPRVLLRVPL